MSKTTKSNPRPKAPNFHKQLRTWSYQFQSTKWIVVLCLIAASLERSATTLSYIQASVQPIPSNRRWERKQGERERERSGFSLFQSGLHTPPQRTAGIDNLADLLRRTEPRLSHSVSQIHHNEFSAPYSIVMKWNDGGIL